MSVDRLTTIFARKPEKMQIGLLRECCKLRVGSRTETQPLLHSLNFKHSNAVWGELK